ncbi:TIGR03086 family protein [Streptomyces sp. uw30]|uniref:TIGR03086 family metal-binding protein n=1 Tax=Streptomyces sp. uw30 TaxID=1828179 RepID=UPI0011CDF4D7|nr:TIGR03086 family metal-binding protein [Streptomyces sp. uw30]TXS43853.1 TIGR03086 family protein [Streptomyces sp. uw30]
MSPTRVELLTQSIGLVVKAVDEAPPAKYQDPTPCSDYTVKDLVNHIAMMLLLTRDAGTRAASDSALLTANPVPFLAGRPKSDWAVLVADKAEPAVRAWSEPTAWDGDASLGGRPMAASALGEILIAEFAMHAWDIAVATAQSIHVPKSLAVAAFETYTREAPRMRGLGLLADEVLPHTDASPFDCALGLSGRDPRWSPPTPTQ